jgi:hypothetical protein
VFELRTLGLLGRCSAATCPALFALDYFSNKVLLFFFNFL